MKSVNLIIMVLIFSVSPAFAGNGGIVEEWTILFPSIQYFTWEEFSADSRILKEEGPLVGLGGSVRLNLYDEKVMLKAKAELFGGDVYYDGQTQNGIPVKTDVIYFGTKLESDLGWRFNLGKVSLEPFAGLGYRWWLRALQDSVTDDGNGTPVSGTDERWQSFYSRLGGRATWSLTKEFAMFAEGGGKYPFYNENRADSPAGGKVTVKPGKEWSAFAEIGLTYKRFRPSIFYEGFRFSRSDLVRIGSNLAVFQPKSDSDIFGINLNWVF